MARRLPPLNAMRAFEAAARHLSFTTAADELNVTQAAISHQVKALEQWLGVPLFRRLNRALLLTDAGQNYAPPLGDAFDELAGATDRLRADDNRTDWTVWFLAAGIQGGDPTQAWCCRPRPKARAWPWDAAPWPPTTSPPTAWSSPST